MKKILSFAINILVALLITTGVVWAATTIGTNVTTTGDLTIGDGTASVTQDGEDAYIEGTLEVDGASRFDGALTANGANTFAGKVTLANASTTGVISVGDAATDNLVLNSRVSTVVTKGDSIDIGTTYLYGEGMELRYTVDGWPTGQGSFNGIYMKVQTDAGGDAAKGQSGINIESVANNVSMNNLAGGYFSAWQKGSTARTIGSMYGVTAELMFSDSSDVTFSTAATATAAAAAFRGIVKTDSTMVNADARLQGIDLLFGTVDGIPDNKTIFAGINMRDDPATAGVVTLRYGLKMNELAAGISVADIVLSKGDTIWNTAASTTLISGRLGIATSTITADSDKFLSIGTGASTTIDISKGCFQGNSIDGARYHMWFKTGGTIGIAAGNCP